MRDSTAQGSSAGVLGGTSYTISTPRPSFSVEEVRPENASNSPSSNVIGQSNDPALYPVQTQQAPTGGLTPNQPAPPQPAAAQTYQPESQPQPDAWASGQNQFSSPQSAVSPIATRPMAEVNQFQMPISQPSPSLNTPSVQPEQPTPDFAQPPLTASPSSVQPQPETWATGQNQVNLTETPSTFEPEIQSTPTTTPPTQNMLPGQAAPFGQNVPLQPAAAIAQPAIPAQVQAPLTSGKGLSHKLLFLIPAVLLIATIAIVAYLAGDNYSVRQPETPAIVPIEEPSLESPEAPVNPVVPTTKEYINESMLIKMNVPADFDVLVENSDFVSMGIGNIELLAVRQNFQYEAGENAEEVVLGASPAVRFQLSENGTPVNVVQSEEKGIELAFYPEEASDLSDFDAILSSLIFLLDTSSWETFENQAHSYNLLHPATWSVVEVSPSRSEVRRDVSETNFHNLIIEVSSGVANAGLTASEIVSSTRAISGWKQAPKVELRTMGAANAQIISGELAGRWQAYVVIWYRTTVVQMTWTDTLEQLERQTFDNILASFEFTN